MIRHIVKLAWKRKGTNVILIVEIFVTFLVLTGVFITGLFYLGNYMEPLGFEYEHVWELYARHTDIEIARIDMETPDIRDTLAQVTESLTAIPEIEHVCFSPYLHPFSDWGNMMPYTYEGKTVYCGYTATGDGFPEVFRPDLVAGRWFDASDEGSHRIPIVVTKRMGKELFGEELPLGKVLEWRHWRTGELIEHEVVGVLNSFKKYGELNKPRSYMLQYQSSAQPIEQSDFSLYIRVTPSATAKLEEKIMPVLRTVARDFTCTINPLEVRRETQIKTQLTLYSIFGVIGVSLLIMIGLGIFGVLWQNISRRTVEIGVRRANGATRRSIYTQILGELLIVSSCALLTGALVIAQLYLMDALGDVNGRTCFLGIVSGVLVMFGMIVCCSLYPGYTATRIHPAEALHYE